MDEDYTSSTSNSKGDNDLPSNDFLRVLEVLEEMGGIEPHHNCSTKRLLNHRGPGEGNIIFYLTNRDEDIQASITFPNREKYWEDSATNYEGDLEFTSILFQNTFSKSDLTELRDVLSDSLIKVHTTSEPVSLILRIPSEGTLLISDKFSQDLDQRDIAVRSALSTIRGISRHFEKLENSQYHIDKLKDIIQG